MGHKYIVLGTRRKDGKFDVLADPSVEPTKQKDILVKNAETSDDYKEVQMFRLEPHTRSYSPITKAAKKAAQKTEPAKPEVAKPETEKPQETAPAVPAA